MMKNNILIFILVVALFYVGWNFFDKEETKFDMVEVIKTDSGLIARVEMYEDSISKLVQSNKKMKEMIAHENAAIKNLRDSLKDKKTQIQSESEQESIDRFCKSTLGTVIPKIKSIDSIPVIAIKKANELIAERHHYKELFERQKDKVTLLEGIASNNAFIIKQKNKIIKTIEQRNSHLKFNLEAQEKHYKERLRKENLRNKIKLGIVSGLAALIIIFG